MISPFPHFKKLELSDKPTVESMTLGFPPYSDFNFVSMWSWDTSEEREIAELNGNLVVKFTDYRTNEPFLSFIGHTDLEHTARTLIDYGKASGLPDWLQLVPEESIRDMRTAVMHIEEDRANFDYVYSVPVLSAMKGSTFEAKRKMIRRFKRTLPDAHIETVDLADIGAQQDAISVLKQWEKNKIQDGKEYELEHEEAALRKLFTSAGAHNLLVTGLFAKGSMVGFSIEELLTNGYCVGHFWKADVSHEGIYDYLMNEKARHFETLGMQFINYEQDLGIHSLRMSKDAFRPVAFLKKYIVSLAEEAAPENSTGALAGAGTGVQST